MAFGMEQLLPLALGASLGGMFNKRQEASPIVMPSVTLPNPVEPPRAPLNPSMTAAPIRAKLNQNATGNSDIVLSSASSRRDDPAAISRTTLLGA